MKEIILPASTDATIDLGQISSNFQGIIICYKNNVEVGYIVTDDEDYWHFNNYINSDDHGFPEDPILLDLLIALIKNDICSSFKVIEFK